MAHTQVRLLACSCSAMLTSGWNVSASWWLPSGADRCCVICATSAEMAGLRKSAGEADGGGRSECGL